MRESPGYEIKKWQCILQLCSRKKRARGIDNHGWFNTEAQVADCTHQVIAHRAFHGAGEAQMVDQAHITVRSRGHQKIITPYIPVNEAMYPQLPDDLKHLSDVPLFKGLSYPFSLRAR